MIAGTDDFYSLPEIVAIIREDIAHEEWRAQHPPAEEPDWEGVPL